MCGVSSSYLCNLQVYLRKEGESVEQQQGATELSMGWVDPWVGLGWFGLGRVEIFQFLVGWVGSTTAKVLKI